LDLARPRRHAVLGRATSWLFVAVSCASCLHHSHSAALAPSARRSPEIAAGTRAVPDLAETPSSTVTPALLVPTWDAIYGRYFGPHSEGGCGRTGGCHANEMSDSTSAYSWLADRGYIAGTTSALVSRTNSCLRWFGGNMPPRGAPNEDAVRDLTAWVAAGATSH